MEVQIFDITISDRSSGAALQIAGGREFETESFYLEFAEFVLSTSRDQAASFSSAVSRIVWRLKEASATGKAAKAGAVYRREVGDGVTK